MKERTGHDMEGFERVLDSGHVNHILLRHGDQTREVKKGQLAVTHADLSLYPRIVAAAHSVVPGKGTGGGATVEYTADFGRFRYSLIEVVQSGQGRAALKSMWKRRK